METGDFSTSFVVDQTPGEVFNAVTNVRGWWSEQIDGKAKNLHDEFTYRFEDVHRCHVRLVEVVPGKKVVWLVLDNFFSFTKDTTEWKGTHMIFEIVEQDGKSHLHFTHH